MSPRQKFIKKFDDTKLAAVVWDLMKLATSHDPDILKAIRNLDSQVAVLDRRLGKYPKLPGSGSIASVPRGIGGSVERRTNL